MADRYAYARRRIAHRAAQFNTGVVTLTRTANAAPDETTPWIPGAATLDLYELDVVVSDVAAEYIDGTLIVASDLMVVASPKAKHLEHAGEDVDGTPVVDLEPQMSDVLKIDGAPKEIKRILPAPAAGDAAVYRIFVASGG